MKLKNRLQKISIYRFLFWVLLFLSGISVSAQTITIQGNKFYVNSTQRIWLNGVNTPWHSWNDFGGTFDRNWWNTHFETLKSYGINSSRVWISCNGGGAVKTDATGVTGVSSTFYKNCDTLFAIAQRNGIYIDATMISFDHFKDTNANYLNWRTIVTDPVASQTFIDNYLIPFVNRYKTNPYLFAINLCNEPEWILENVENGKLPKANLQRFFAMCAAAIHNNSSVPVTIGSACIKWNSTSAGCVGNYWSNTALKAAFNDPKAFLDFYCVHYYAWIHPWYKSPYEKTPTDYNINDRPVIIEESPGNDAGLADIPVTVTQSYESALLKGYQGNMPWTSNGVDTNGDITTIGPAALAFKNNHPELVYPLLFTAKPEVLTKVPFSIYPNPTSGKFTIEEIRKQGQFTNIEIFNALGELIFQKDGVNMQSSAELDISNYPKGIYVIKIFRGADLFIRKIVLQKP
jgi:hypothetical protein